MSTSLPHDEATRQLRRLRWTIRLLAVFYVVWGAFVLYWLIPLGIRFPGASLSALIGASVGYIRARRRGLRAIDPGPSEKQIPPLEASTILWGMCVGAVGYALLAALRIGVPSPDAPLGWRVLGGLVFGAVGGIAAGFLLPMLEILATMLSRKRAA